MGKGRGKRNGGRPGRVIAVWLVAALLLLLLLAALADRLRWNRDQLSMAGAAALLTATAAAAFALGRRLGKFSPARAALGALALSALLLLIGFLIDAKAMSLSGLSRVTFCCLLGSLLGMKIGSLSAGKRSGRTMQIKKRNSA